MMINFDVFGKLFLIPLVITMVIFFLFLMIMEWTSFKKRNFKKRIHKGE